MSSRNWKEYNEQLVRRGEALLDFDFLKGWGVELKEMNAGKRGKSYDYPLSYVRFSAFKKIFGGHARAKDFDNMVREMRLKAFVYNFLASC